MNKNSRENSPVKRKGEAISPPGPDIAGDRLEQLRQIVPEAFTEGKIDFEKFRTAMGADVDERPERFSFTWSGKRQAILELQKPTWGTLVPDKGESVNFDTTQNVFIEGENLEVLKLLYKSYFGRVKLVYIDPPYNTGNDFVYTDNFADPKEAYLKITGQKDAEGNLLTSNPETGGRYHSAWLSMMYPRLFLARQLLRDDGVIFVSIDDHEIHNLRLLMNEIFGEENFIAQITILNNPKGRVLGEHFALCHDYLVAYSRTALTEELGVERTAAEIEATYPLEENGRRYRIGELRNTHRQFNRKTRQKLWFPLYVDPKSGVVSLENVKGYVEVLPIWEDGLEGCWTWGKTKVTKQLKDLSGKQIDGRWKIMRKSFATDENGNPVLRKLQTIWSAREFHTEVGQAALEALIPGRVFDSPKPVGLLRQIIEVATDPDDEDIVLDFYAGSGTSAQAILELNQARGSNRRFIGVQLPQPTDAESNAKQKGFATIAEVTKERIRKVIAQFKQQKVGELDMQAGDFDAGFEVFKLKPSNFKPWPGSDTKTPADYANTMELFADPLVDGWKIEPVIYEVALREGYSLTSRVEKLSGIKGNTVWRVTDADKGQSFRICLDDELQTATVRALELTKDDLFICRDAALDDKLAANLALQCRLRTI